MEIYFDKTRQHMTKEFHGQVKDLLKKLEINPTTVIVTRDDVLLTEQDKVSNDDRIKILSVVSGG